MPKLNCDFTVESTFFSLADEPSLGVLQQAHSRSDWLFCAMHEEHDHLAVCWETIFLKISSTTGAAAAADTVVVDWAAVVVVVDWAVIVVTAEGVPKLNVARSVVDVAATGTASVGAADDVGADNDEEDDVESTVGAALPKAKVPNGTACFVIVDVLEVVVLSFFKLPNVKEVAFDLVLSSGFATPNMGCEDVLDLDPAAGSAKAFEPNENFPLGAPKSIAPLPNENFGLAAAASPLFLACKQQTHFDLLMSFLVSHTEQDHVELFCFAAIDLNKSSGFVVELKLVAGCAMLPPGLFSPQHKHLVWATSLSAMHESHFHFDCFCLAAMDLKTSSTIAVAPLLDEIDVERVGAVEVRPTPQHTHFVAEFPFGVMHDEHDHLFCVCFATSALKDSSCFPVDSVITVFGAAIVNPNSIFFGSVEVVAGGFDIDTDDGIAVLVDFADLFIRIGSLKL